MSLETTIEQVEGDVPLTILALDGELDASNFEGLIDTVRRLYDGGTRQLLIDLADLRFMASSGLVALHSIVRIMHGEPPPDPEAGWSRPARGCRAGPDRGPAVRRPAGGRARPVADGPGPALHRARGSGRGPRRALTRNRGPR